MYLQKLGNNCHVLRFSNTDEIFFSYETPVAADIDGMLIRTTKQWSITTTKHINMYLEGRQAKGVHQSKLDQLEVNVGLSDVTED